MQKPRALGGSESGFVTPEVFTTEGIQDLLGFGFRVGDDHRVNENDRTYYYAAFDDRAPTSADLTVALAVDDAHAGRTAVRRLHAHRHQPGARRRHGVRVQTSLPAGLQVDQAPRAAAAPTTWMTGVWDLGNLAAGSGARLAVTARPGAGTAGQTLHATADVVAAAQVDPVAANNAASAAVVVASSDLARLPGRRPTRRPTRGSS